MNKLNIEIQKANTAYSTFKGTHALIVTWHNTGYRDSFKILQSTFQAILVTNLINSFVILNYGRVEYKNVINILISEFRNSPYNIYMSNPKSGKTILNVDKIGNLLYFQKKFWGANT